MSKKVVYFMMLAFSLTIFAGCSDDDDDDNVVDYAKDVQATYGGTLNVVLPGIDPISSEENIVLKRTDVNKVEVTLDKISVPTGEEGATLDVTDIKVPNIPVTKSGDTYTLTAPEQTVSVKLAGEVPVDVKITVSGTVKNNKLDANIKVAVPAVMANPAMEIPVTFSGERLNK